MIELGDLVKDEITGFEGIVIGITNWLFGCKRIGIQPRNKPLESLWFDAPQIKILEKNIMNMRAKTNAGKG